ncbi:MAG: T9SS type A sorting domain-containing protein, partial [Chitinophagales bacterium]|nr:T9SS type A sorting domain-containing protein [Chitinophagales bacterium]
AHTAIENCTNLCEGVNCDDNDECTVDACADGICSNDAIDCNDNNDCTDDACTAGECRHTTVTCNDNDGCTTDACENGECAFTPVDCNDNNDCTTDACDNDQCTNTPIQDCTDLCANVNCEDNDDCTTDICGNGICSYTPVFCNDNDGCTTDACQDGQCAYTAISCNDNNSCTTDNCVNGQCASSPVSCNDNDACTIDACSEGQCAFTALDCNDNNDCTNDACVSGGCSNTPIQGCIDLCANVNCEDNNACTTDACENGECLHTSVICNDNNSCTTDICNAQSGCVYTPVNCNDNNSCTTDDCNDGICSNTPILCNDNNSCTADICNSGQCQYTPVPCSAINPDLIPDCGLDLIFILDESGSIVGEGGANNISAQVRAAANGVLNALNGTGSRVAIVEFNSEARRAVINGTTSLQEVNAGSIVGFLSYIGPDGNNSGSNTSYDPEDYSSSDFYTNWEDAFNEVQSINTAEGTVPLVLFFTDGMPTAYNIAQGGVTQGTGSSIETQALLEAAGAANAVKAQGSHVFVIGIPNPTLPEANVIAVSGQDKYPSPEADFTKGDYSISSSDKLEEDLIAIASLVCNADLRISKIVSPPSGCPGNTVTFVLTVTNDGLEDATGIEAKDYLPNGYTYISDNGGAATTEANRTITWTIGSLNNGQSATLQITATVNGSGDYKNVAEITASSKTDGDSESANYDGSPLEDDEAEATFIQECSDNDPCTVDACVNGSCTHTGVICDDEDACTTDKCNNGTCSYSPENCHDGNDCTNDFCENGICQFVPINCSDSDECTTDNCDDGECYYTPVSCDDNNSCTTDACANGQCTHTPGLLNIDIEKTDMGCFCAASQDQLCLLDFAGLAPGTMVSEQYADDGIHIYAKANAGPVTRPYVFNTNGSGSPDPDLEVGVGNALIIPIDNVQTDNDNDEGGEITFAFDNDRTVLSITVIDFDDANCGLCIVELYDRFNNLVKTIPIPAAADGSVQLLPINTSGVRMMVVKYFESGAITNIVFGCDEPCCDGSATATVSGSSAQNAYYTWGNGQQTIAQGTNLNTINELCPGDYTVTVTDDAGCSVHSTFTINNPDEAICAECIFDCTGECNGTAFIDGCGICVGGNTGNQPCTCYLGITGLTLMYEGNYGEISALTEGLVIDRGQYCRVNIRANLCQMPAGSVKFVLNGSTTKIENSAPYAFWGDNAGSYKPWVAQGGNHTLVVTAYSGLNATGAAGVSYNVHFSVTGSSSSYACSNPPRVCTGGCKDNNPCTTDACTNGQCVYTPVSISDGNACTNDYCNPQTGVISHSPKNCNDGDPCTIDGICNLVTGCSNVAIPNCCDSNSDCEDGDLCTIDYCSQGYCAHQQGGAGEASYLKVVNLAKSWRKLKLGYSNNNIYGPKQNVTVGGNNQMCITMRDALGTAQWSKIQVRPLGASSSPVNLGSYVPANVGTNWFTICIPLSTFSSVNFTQLTFLEIPYSDGAGAFEIHLQRIVFSGGATPFLWFGDPKTDNLHDGQSGSGSALIAMLVPGNPCSRAKMDSGILISEQLSNEDETGIYLNAYPNPFSEEVNIEFTLTQDARVRLEIVNLEGKIMGDVFEGNVKAGMMQSNKFRSGTLANGMYFYRLITESGDVQNRKLVLFR